MLGLRCYTLGFLVAAEAPVRLEAAVTTEDGSSRPVELELPASPAVGGIVEVEPVPVFGRGMRLSVETEAEQVELYDLFVIATG